MARKKKTEVSLEEEIEQLRELLRKASEKMSADPKPEEWLAVLDSVSKAAPQLARLLKVQRELESEDLDPVEVLREALAELEEEWPELHECKEKLRNGGLEEKSTHAAPMELGQANAEYAEGNPEKCLGVLKKHGV